MPTAETGHAREERSGRVDLVEHPVSGDPLLWGAFGELPARLILLVPVPHQPAGVGTMCSAQKLLRKENTAVARLRPQVAVDGFGFGLGTVPIPDVVGGVGMPVVYRLRQWAHLERVPWDLCAIGSRYCPVDHVAGVGPRDLGVQQLNVPLPEKRRGLLEQGQEVVARRTRAPRIEVLPRRLIYVKAARVRRDMDHRVLKGMSLTNFAS